MPLQISAGVGKDSPVDGATGVSRATHLNATVEGEVIKGTYGNSLIGVHDIELRRHRATAPASSAPDINGLWTLPFESPKGEHAWRFIVRQHRSEVSAAILRVDGDTGVLTGVFKDGSFVLSHFDDGRPLQVTIVPRADGELDVTLRGPHAPNQILTAIRPSEARAKGLPSPSVFAGHTTMKNPGEPLRFSFPDLSGNLVSNTDPRFKDKVLVVNITGSWCPNCHDEAPFLAEMHRRYHPLGLEIVAIDFEDEEQLRNPTRLRAFIQHYGIARVERRCSMPVAATIHTTRVSPGPGPGYPRRAVAANAEPPARRALPKDSPSSAK